MLRSALLVASCSMLCIFAQPSRAQDRVELFGGYSYARVPITNVTAIVLTSELPARLSLFAGYRGGQWLGGHRRDQSESLVWCWRRLRRILCVRVRLERSSPNIFVWPPGLAPSQDFSICTCAGRRRTRNYKCRQHKCIFLGIWWRAGSEVAPFRIASRDPDGLYGDAVWWLNSEPVPSFDGSGFAFLKLDCGRCGRD